LFGNSDPQAQIASPRSDSMLTKNGTASWLTSYSPGRSYPGVRVYDTASVSMMSVNKALGLQNGFTDKGHRSSNQDDVAWMKFVWGCDKP
jgi:hypothetical protein